MLDLDVLGRNHGWWLRGATVVGYIAARRWRDAYAPMSLPGTRLSSLHMWLLLQPEPAWSDGNVLQHIPPTSDQVFRRNSTHPALRAMHKQGRGEKGRCMNLGHPILGCTRVSCGRGLVAKVRADLTRRRMFTIPRQREASCKRLVLENKTLDRNGNLYRVEASE